MKYYVTFETSNYGHSILMSGKSEMTWVCDSEDKLPETLQKVSVNNHRLVRIVRGEEVKFEQRYEVTLTGEPIKAP